MKSLNFARYRWFVWCTLAVMSGCRSRSGDWNGTWIVNPSKGNFHGPTFRISISGDGEYRYDDGVLAFTFRCDGKDRKTANGRTLACVNSSIGSLALVGKENGVSTNVDRWQLSADGEILRLSRTIIRPGAPSVTSQVVASRLSGSGDFVGRWRDTTYLQSHAEMTLKLDSQAIHIDYLNAGQYIDGPFNGVGAAVRGVHAPQGITYTAKLVGQHEIRTLASLDEKAILEHSFQLSGDGKTIAESWWNPGQPTAAGTLIYEKK